MSAFFLSVLLVATIFPSGLVEVTGPGVELKGLTTFEGTCDASAAVPLDERRFAVADDETNYLRVYDAERGGAPIRTIDVAALLEFDAEGWREIDLEAATGLRSDGYWLSSHSRLKSGERSVERLHFFATTLPTSDAPVELVGRPYRSLLEALATADPLRRFELDRAARRGPQSDGGLNIEALTAAPDGRLLIGFRNPIPDGLALFVPLLNARQMALGEPPRFGPPIRIDLNGGGARGLSWWHGDYWIIGGAHDDRHISRLYTWDGDETHPKAAELARFGDFNAEGFFTPEERDEMMVLSDDGGRLIDGVPCKLLEDPKQKQFRGLWLTRPATD